MESTGNSIFSIKLLTSNEPSLATRAFPAEPSLSLGFRLHSSDRLDLVVVSKSREAPLEPSLLDVREHVHTLDMN